MTRLSLAQKVGGSHATVGYLETHQRLPSLETVARLAEALGLSAAWLAYGLGEQSNAGTASSYAGMGERLRTVRIERGLTKAALARLAELNPGSIAGIEKGGQAGVDTIERLAKELRISPAWLGFASGQKELAPRRRTARPAAHP
jgi:transcriptional regulator with XRE-family HTH domain